MYPQWYYNCHGVLPDQCLLTSWFEMMTHDVISPDTSTTIKSLCLYWSAHKTVAHWSRRRVAPQGPTEAVRVARWHSRLLNLAFLSFYYSLYLKRSTGGGGISYASILAPPLLWWIQWAVSPQSHCPGGCAHYCWPSVTQHTSFVCLL